MAVSCPSCKAPFSAEVEIDLPDPVTVGKIVEEPGSMPAEFKTICEKFPELCGEVKALTGKVEGLSSKLADGLAIDQESINNLLDAHAKRQAPQPEPLKPAAELPKAEALKPPAPPKPKQFKVSELPFSLAAFGLAAETDEGTGEFRLRATDKDRFESAAQVGDQFKGCKLVKDAEGAHWVCAGEG